MGDPRVPFAVPIADDPSMAELMTADGQRVRIPLAAAQSAGVEVRQPQVPLLEAQPEIPAALARTPDAIPPMLARDPGPAAAGPAPELLGVDLGVDPFNAGADARRAAIRAQLEANSGPAVPAGTAPAALERAPVPVIDPFTPAAGLQRQEGEEIVRGAPMTGGAPGRSRAPRAAPPPADPDAQLIDDLIARPVAGEAGHRPIAPRDSRVTGPLAQAELRLDAQRERNQAAAENVQAAAIDRERLAQDAQARADEIEARRAQALTSATESYARAVQEARSAEVNPARLFQNGGGIAVAIASVLGSLGSALTGGPNTALDTINRAIDRDIQAQTTNQANAQRTAQNARAFIDITRQRFTDERAQVEAARSMALDQVAQRLERQSAALTSAGARDEAAAAVAQLRQQALQSAQAAAQAEQERILSQREQMANIRVREAEATRAERRAAGGGGGSGAGQLSRAARLARQLEQAGVSREAALQAAGLGGLPMDQESELSGQERGNVAAAEQALARVESLVPEDGDIPGFGVLDSLRPDIVAGTEGRQLRQAVRSLVEIYGRLHSGGAISDDEFALFNSVIGSGRFQTEQELRDGLRAVRAEIEARRAGRGGPPG